ncbi:PDZ domain-containing protein [Sphingomonas sp. CL5.1]|uniref:PDZ domain-containing protein n=1 Tax=Sphingomonas sp. CL5.1 TaxID=2653203 RepID=UPI001582BCDF|nr:PDZ domain-containing protein [Sphingomonas sp. CL5.1]QKS00997.1 PDZ domain-containing protein [Sphingomonas sp. CL5.1]
MNGLRMAGWAAVGAAAVGAGAFGLLADNVPRVAAPRGAVGGATYSPVSHVRHHALVVTSLRTGGAEAAAGLKVGDMVEAIDGHAGATLATLRAAEARRPPAVLKVQRNGDVFTLTLLKEVPGGAS